MATATSSRQPAILGGAPAVTLDQAEANRWPVIGDEDERAVVEVLRSGHLSINPVVQALEDDYRQWLGVRHTLAHCNGTSAILAALHAFGIEPGDEVIVPSATWWSTVTPVLHVGGIPVFAELEPDCLGLDPDDVAARITDRTKAIVVVHLFGMPSKMNELKAVAARHGLRVLEDAAHAHGATYGGKPVGSLADAAVFSMQTNKLLPAGEGGMLVTDDDEIAEKALRFGHYERLLQLPTPNRRFAATGFGYKFRIAPMSAALARAQLAKLPQRNKQRNENLVYLSKKLETLGLQTFLSPADPPGTERVYFEYLIRYDEQRHGTPIDAVVKALQAEGVLVGRPRYPLLHQQPLFSEGHWQTLARLPGEPGRDLPVYDPRDLPRTTAGNGSLLKLPTFPQATRELLDQYACAFEKVMGSLKTLPRTDA